MEVQFHGLRGCGRQDHGSRKGGGYEEKCAGELGGHHGRAAAAECCDVSLVGPVVEEASFVLLQMCEESNGYEAMRRHEIRANKMLPGQNLTGLQPILAF